MVHQKSDCENIVLSAKDKELLKEIKNHPHKTSRMLGRRDLL